jgi:hypothetical protein
LEVLARSLSQFPRRAPMYDGVDNDDDDFGDNDDNVYQG